MWFLSRARSRRSLHVGLLSCVDARANPRWYCQVMLGTIGGAMLSLAPSPGDELVHAGSTAETVGRMMIANAVCFCLYALGIFYWRGRKISTGSASSFVDPIGPALLCVALLGGFIMTLLVHEGGDVAALPRACSTVADQALPQCCRSELLIIRHAEKDNDAPATRAQRRLQAAGFFNKPDQLQHAEGPQQPKDADDPQAARARNEQAEKRG